MFFQAFLEQNILLFRRTDSPGHLSLELIFLLLSVIGFKALAGGGSFGFGLLSFFTVQNYSASRTCQKQIGRIAILAQKWSCWSFPRFTDWSLFELLGH